MKKGFSLIELIIAITIILVVGGVSANTFLNWKTAKSLDVTSRSVAAVLDEARSLAVNGYGVNQHGVYIGAADRVVRFSGAAYDASNASNTTTVLPQGIVIGTSTTGSSVIFQKFTGATANSGTITLWSLTSSSTVRTITVDVSGSVSVK